MVCCDRSGVDLVFLSGFCLRLLRFLNLKIQEGEAHNIFCPAFDCYQLVPVEVIESVVSREMDKRYLRFDIKVMRLKHACMVLARVDRRQEGGLTLGASCWLGLTLLVAGVNRHLWRTIRPSSGAPSQDVKGLWDWTHRVRGLRPLILFTSPCSGLLL